MSKDFTKYEKYERLDDLQFNNFKLYQNTDFFRFGLDAVLLSAFAKVRPAERVMDLCSGTGAVAFLLLAKERVQRITALELLDYFCHLMHKSARVNNCTHKITILEQDVRKIPDTLESGSFDAITVNPPYKKVNTGLINEDYYRAVARHEVLCTLDDVVKGAAHLLCDRGRLYMVHKPERLAEICLTLQQHHMSPRTIQFVHSDKHHAPYLMLIEAVKNQPGPLRFQPPIFVYNNDGTYTQQIQQYYRFGDEQHD